jgi:hypothetical protein
MLILRRRRKRLAARLLRPGNNPQLLAGPLAHPHSSSNSKLLVPLRRNPRLQLLALILPLHKVTAPTVIWKA